MSEYLHLKPLFASSSMSISLKGNFQQIITYDYEDLGSKHLGLKSLHSNSLSDSDPNFHSNSLGKDYFSFLQNADQFNSEISMYWGNLQDELDSEINRVNGKDVQLRIIHCNIHFRTPKNPFVQWIIEFAAPLKKGSNTYENIIEPVTVT
ncbi:MAG: hypothetical protein ACTSYI_18130 [Promethearchaeota archaeon]